MYRSHGTTLTVQTSKRILSIIALYFYYILREKIYLSDNKSSE